jgi:hypothetical protein
MAMISLHTVYLSVISITIMLAASILSVVLVEFGNIDVAQGQSNTTSSSLTPQQKAAMCNPSDKFINDTESSICGIPATPANATSSAANTTPTIAKQSPLYRQGHVKGVADAKSVQVTTPPTSTMRPDDVDCDSSFDPQASNVDYCSGYQHGYADTNNNELLGK